MELEKKEKKILIYGAKSIALGVCRAVKTLYPDREVLGFLVTSQIGNSQRLDGLPVIEAAAYAKQCREKDNIVVLIGTPETEHEEILQILTQYGFRYCVGVDWRLEEELMEEYYVRLGKFPSLHRLCLKEDTKTHGEKLFRVFLTKSHIDLCIRKSYDGRPWICTLQAGAEQGGRQIAEYADNTGEHISNKNRTYSELTALYWIWKNVLNQNQDSECEYYGMYQYRRILHMDEEDMKRVCENQIDVILPFPTIHEPDMTEHHARYIKEEDWEAMLQALRELRPEYAKAFGTIMGQPYLYNYNILVARKEILRDYCAWLFPVLERTEELSVPKGWEREDRYLGYLSESLLTLYFLYHADTFRIVHAGRVMLT